MNPTMISSMFGVSALLAAALAWPLGAAARPSRLPAPGHEPACCGSPSNTTVEHHALTLDGANAVLAAAAARARERNASGAIAVVDDGGALLAFQRLDGTFPAGAAVSIGKARTAALFRKPTKVFEDAINGGRTALAAAPDLTPLQGGVPILHEGHLVGAIGVSGAHTQQEDEDIALAGAAALAADPSASTR